MSWAVSISPVATSAGTASNRPANGARAHPVNTGAAAGIIPNRANTRSPDRSGGAANTGTTAPPRSTPPPASGSGSGSGSGEVSRTASEVVAGPTPSAPSSASRIALRTLPWDTLICSAISR